MCYISYYGWTQGSAFKRKRAHILSCPMWGVNSQSSYNLHTEATPQLPVRQHVCSTRHGEFIETKCLPYHTFLNENCFILITISLRFIPRGPINNMSLITHLMTWTNRRQTILWINDGLVNWLLYASLGFDEFNAWRRKQNSRHFANSTTSW